MLTKDFQCVTGWRVPAHALDGCAVVAPSSDRAGVKANGTALRFTSFDGAYTESLTMDQARPQ